MIKYINAVLIYAFSDMLSFTRLFLLESKTKKFTLLLTWVNLLTEHTLLFVLLLPRLFLMTFKIACLNHRDINPMGWRSG